MKGLVMFRCVLAKMAETDKGGEKLLAATDGTGGGSLLGQQ